MDCTTSFNSDHGSFAELMSLGSNLGLSKEIYLASLLVLLSLSLYFWQGKSFQAPFVGYRSFWEPTFIVRLRFVTGAWPIIMEGYSRYKNGIFKIRRNDTDIVIVSNKYVDELRALPEEKASAIEAHIKNLLGPYSTTDLLLESDIHTRMLQSKLTPNLSYFIGKIKEELDFAIQEDMPEVNDWTEIGIYEITLRLVARISARVFVGLPLCRNEEWITASIDYTENIFMTVIALRAIPRFLHPVAVRFLPYWYRIHQNLRTAKRLICPIVDEWNNHGVNGYELDQKSDFTLLKWMFEAATLDIEKDSKKLAHRELIMSLGAIHTTTMATAHFFYDLCAHPEYWIPLRAEIDQCIPNGELDKQSLLKMRMVESFMKESQRLNPPSLCETKSLGYSILLSNMLIMAFNRIIKQPLTLSDGTILPQNTHIAVASAPILIDPAIVSEPSKFDPLRSYRKRQESGEANKHLWAMTDKDNLHFGHGRYSCPGRFFAANEIKIIIARLLTVYDFKYPEGKGRPRNFTADENIYPDPKARLLVRKRHGE